MLAAAALGLAILAVMSFLPGNRASTGQANLESTLTSGVDLDATVIAHATGEAPTWGDLEAFYGLDDEVLRWSLDATFNQNYTLEEVLARKRSRLPAHIKLVVREQNRTYRRVD